MNASLLFSSNWMHIQLYHDKKKLRRLEVNAARLALDQHH